MSRHRSGYVRININDVIGEIEDDCLLAELVSRKLTAAQPGETCDLDIVREAYDALLRGDRTEAQSVLGGLLFPKWKSASSCENQYKMLLKRQ